MGNSTMARQQEENENLLFVPDDFKYGEMVSACDISVRYQFIKKVYFLLGLQLFFTFVSQVLFFYDIIPRQLIFNKLIQIPAFIGSFVLCIVLMLSTANTDDYDDDNDEQGRGYSSSSGGFFSFLSPIKMKYSTQLLLLGFFTVCESISISFITIIYNPRIIMAAVLCTLVVVVSTTLFAMRQASYYANQGSAELEFQENKSLFKIYNVLWVLSTFLFGFGLILMIMPYNSKSDLIFAWIGTVLFTLYLYVDSYMMLRKVRPNEEIKCCMMLYLDIINLFLNILRILAHSSNDD